MDIADLASRLSGSARLRGDRKGVLTMTTKTKSVIYYLYFASQKPVAANIVDAIFNKYRQQ